MQTTGLEARARDILRLIPSLRNMLRPINRLPPEIISHIARDVLDEAHTTDTRSIIPLTHMCRYWRESITCDPRNWALISSRSERLAALSLERARGVPLKVYFHTGGKSGLSDMITPYIQNVAALTLSQLTTPEDLMHTLQDFPESMPKLQSLEMSLSPHAYNWNSPINNFNSFPSTLKCLSLHNTFHPSFLGLRTLTKFILRNYDRPVDVGAFLTIVEENRLLEHLELEIGHLGCTFTPSWRRVPIANQLRHFSLVCYFPKDAGMLISSIPLKEGANLEIASSGLNLVLNSTLPCDLATHSANLQSPTYVYSCGRHIRLRGQNGSFSFTGLSDSEMSFSDLPLLSFDNVRELRFAYSRRPPTTGLRVFDPSHFPALETLAVEHDSKPEITLSILLSSSESCPSLKALAFLDCHLSGGFLKNLRQFASDRKKTTSMWLGRIVVVFHPGGGIQGGNLVRTLEKDVPVVDFRFGTELPGDLMST